MGSEKRRQILIITWGKSAIAGEDTIWFLFLLIDLYYFLQEIGLPP